MPFSRDAFKSYQLGVPCRQEETREHIVPVILRFPQITLGNMIYVRYLPLIQQSVVKPGNLEKVAKPLKLGHELRENVLEPRIARAFSPPVVQISVILNLDYSLICVRDNLQTVGDRGHYFWLGYRELPFLPLPELFKLLDDRWGLNAFCPARIQETLPIPSKMGSG